MIVWLPISVFEVEYQVVVGRPYSVFERTLLEFVAEGHGVPGQLVDLLKVQQSVVIQGLATLMQAGWIALAAETAQGYVLTTAGKSALKADGSLPPNRLLDERKKHVVMERRWRNVCDASDVRYVKDRVKRESETRGEPSATVRPAYSEGPEAGEVRPCLPIEKLEFQRILGIGPITARYPDGNWLRLDVNTETSRVLNLPPMWREDIRLVQDVVEAALTIEQLDDDQVQACLAWAEAEADTEFDEQELLDDEVDQQADGEVEKDRHRALKVKKRQQRFAIADPNEFRFLVGQRRHEEYLDAQFRRAAAGETKCMILHSETLDASVIQRSIRMFQGALESGTNIDFLFGRIPARGTEAAQSHQRALSFLENFQKATQTSIAGRLIVNSQPTGLPQSLLLCDATESPETAVGSHAWFGLPARGGPLTCCTTTPLIVARICRIIGDAMARSQQLQSSYNRQRLQNLAGRLEGCDASRTPGEYTAKGAVVTTREYGSKLLNWCRSDNAPTQRRCRFFARKVDGAPSRTLIEWTSAQSDGGVGWTLTTPVEVSEDVHRLLEEHGVEVVIDPEVDANFLVAGDDDLLIGSFQWLSPENRPDRPDEMLLPDLGLWLNVEGVAALLDKALAAR